MRRVFGVLLGTAGALGIALSASASTCDLTVAGNSCSIASTTGGTAIYTQISPQSTGTGVIDSFVRIQNNGTETGFNTDAAPPDDAKAGTFTHSLLLTAVPIVTINGVQYREFLLDVNQSNPSTISLDQVQIYQASSGTIATDSALFATHLDYSLNTSNDTPNSILLDYALNSGSGSGDMFLFVPNSDFSSANGAYVYLYSAYGFLGAPYQTNDGFEEWAVLQGTVPPPPPVPEPGTLVLLGTGFFGLAGMARRRFAGRK